MANGLNSNVRFYKLNVLPNFDGNKHKGIFVHVAETMHNITWTPTNYKEAVNPKTLLITTPDIYLDKWLSTRHITEIASGLWFGGENGWELLSNETNSAAINAAIVAKINALDVEGYTQAGITTTTNSSTLTIKGIQEVNGLIGAADGSDNVDFDIAIDGVYNESSNKIATQSTVNNKIGTLDANAFQTVTKSPSGVNTVLTFNGIKEVDGIISQGVTENAETFTVGDAKLNIEIGTDSFEVFSANAEENKSIYLDKNVFKKNVVEGKNVLSVIALTDVSSTNPLVTKNDINGLATAMHYRGGVTSVPTADNSTKKGDVWIVTTAFTTVSDSYEAGDMFIARADGENATFDKVQGNLTLGTGDGQIAKNDGDLTPNYMVIATSNGIKTIGISETQLTGDDNNKRELSYRNGTPDTDTTNNITLHHDVTISDAFQVIGKDFTKTINISSTNRSIEIAANGNTGVVVDLVWNTIMEP